MQITPVGELQRVFDDNVMLGYVENQMLYGIDRDGYAVALGTIEHDNEIIPKLTAWIQINGRPSRKHK